MGVKPGYKQTEVGVIPEDWESMPLNEIGRPVRGGSPRPAGDARYFDGSYIPWLTVAALTNIPHSQLIVNETATCLTEEGSLRSRTLEPGTLIIANSGATLGVAKILGIKCCANDGVAALLNLAKKVSPFYLSHVINTKTDYLRDVVATGNGQPNLNTTLIGDFKVPLPPTKAEQDAIAETLNDADALIESLEQLLAKKRHIKQGAMQELLTGKKRLPGFTKGWEKKRIAEIAQPSSEKNTAADSLTVLTCSKHLGFVDSLTYFKNQVFSRDTRGYKVIRRGQLGYPSNHVEEGSIGLQDLYDAALVSPIYVVFSPKEWVNSYFLHRLLKLDSYREKFEAATSSSVDRRGSLRWPAFSQIVVSLPDHDEQTAIASVLSDMDAEIAALEAKLAKARGIKQGMMQELLTGRTRLV